MIKNEAQPMNLQRTIDSDYLTRKVSAAWSWLRSRTWPLKSVWKFITGISEASQNQKRKTTLHWNDMLVIYFYLSASLLKADRMIKSMIEKTLLIQLILIIMFGAKLCFYMCCILL